MSVKVKRAILLSSVIIITVVCYIVMNRNYDPLSRYPYEDKEAREAILRNMDELEIKYIIDYSIEPSEFMEYIDVYGFNAFYTDLYNEADAKLYLLTHEEVVSVVNKIEEKKLDFEECMKKYAYVFYDEIMKDIA